MRTVFKPNILSNNAIIGILPPPRVGIGFLPNVVSMASAAA